ncbi:MAG: cytochrome c [Gemmatimonadaceae bacterium]|nr:cytochrome c [Gemmatimonadaceae bacterium]
MNAKALLRRAALAALPLVLGACSWFTDFKQQPSVGTWQVFNPDSAELKGFRGNPAGSVSINGTMMPSWVVSYQQLPNVIDSMSTLANPVAADSASLHRGRLNYQINCAPCHGATGKGNGPATTLGMVPMPLVSDRVKNFTDGYIWGMIRNGRGLMPSYNRIEEMDRWDVVNYIRALQDKVPGYVPDTTPGGLPGETGDKLPGFTRIGPNRNAPVARPVVHVSPAPAAAASEPKTEGHE